MQNYLKEEMESACQNLRNLLEVSMAETKNMSPDMQNLVVEAMDLLEDTKTKYGTEAFPNINRVMEIFQQLGIFNTQETA